MTASSSSSWRMEPPAQAQFTEFLLENSPQYRALHEIRQQVSNLPEADEHYKKRTKAWLKREQWRTQNDKPWKTEQDAYLKRRRDMCRKLDEKQNILQILGESRQPLVMEVGMADGGFSPYTLECYPNTKITGISMPSEEGGSPVCFESENVQSVLKNVGTLAGDLGVSDIPETHRMAPSLTMERVLPAGKLYDLIFCQELPAREAERKKQPREGKIPPCERKLWSDSPEYIRIQTAQLIIAMENLRENGTMVVLMRKPENPPTTELLRLFSEFSNISLFKHDYHYQATSSFYMVAKNVRTRSGKATRAIEKWRKKWKEIMLREAGQADGSEESVGDELDVSELIKWGTELIGLAAPIWDIQGRWLMSLSTRLNKIRSSRRLRSVWLPTNGHPNQVLTGIHFTSCPFATSCSMGS